MALISVISVIKCYSFTINVWTSPVEKWWLVKSDTGILSQLSQLYFFTKIMVLFLFFLKNKIRKSKIFKIQLFSCWKKRQNLFWKFLRIVTPSKNPGAKSWHKIMFVGENLLLHYASFTVKAVRRYVTYSMFYFSWREMLLNPTAAQIFVWEGDIF